MVAPEGIEPSPRGLKARGAAFTPEGRNWSGTRESNTAYPLPKRGDDPASSFQIGREQQNRTVTVVQWSGLANHLVPSTLLSMAPEVGLEPTAS